METAAGEGHRYTPREEIANSVTHGFGIILAIAGLGVLTAFATLHGTAAHIVGCSIFGATLILLYTTSTLYHSIPIERAKSVLRALDHSAIYLLIAGTYTPFSLVNLMVTALIALWVPSMRPVERGDDHIEPIHVADAIEGLVTRSQDSLSEDRSPKNPYRED